MSKQSEINKLIAQIDDLEDSRSELVTKLWRLVDPKPDEIEATRDSLREHEENWDPTDLDILRNILKGDRE